jgi:membrane-bound lytic murein transglycosylase D
MDLALRRALVLFAGFGAGCMAPGSSNPVPDPSVGPESVVHASAPESPAPGGLDRAQSASGDSAGGFAAAISDSLADAAVLEQLAAAHAPEGNTPLQAGDALDALASPSARLDLSTYADHDRVRYYLDFFQGPARARMAIWLTRMPVYEPMVRERFASEGLPDDLVYLGLIESGFSNVAVSRSRAVGMWQFMRGTGRWMGLRIDRWVDERRDPVKATDAAARYLALLTRQFGSHYLAAAAYNGGPGTVSRGLQRIDLGGGDAVAVEGEEEGDEYSDGDFFTLADSRYIRQETKDYVPKLIAAALIARQPTVYGFEPVPEVAPFPRDSVLVPDMTGLDVIARLAGVPTAAIQELNPHYLRMVTPPDVPSVVRLPAGTMERVTAAYASLPARERVAFRSHLVKKGETLSGIGRKYGVSVAALREANPSVRGKKGPRAGQELVIPVGSAAGWTSSDAPAGSRVHTVRSGETLSGIARKYRVTVAQLTEWNGLSRSGMIRTGQKLRLYPGSGAAPTRASSTASTTQAGSRTHLVKRGETLSGLARRYGVSVQALQKANGLSSARDLKAGQKIKIPA